VSTRSSRVRFMASRGRHRITLRRCNKGEAATRDAPRPTWSQRDRRQRDRRQRDHGAGGEHRMPFELKPHEAKRREMVPGGRGAEPRARSHKTYYGTI
jgi:hypothetical protein